MQIALALTLILFLSTVTPTPTEPRITPPDLNRTLTPGTPIPPTPPDLERTPNTITPIPLIERVWMPVILK